MHTNTNTTTRSIVAIDLGKYKSVACVSTGDPTASCGDQGHSWPSPGPPASHLPCSAERQESENVNN
jgi:hypothetical protein